MSASEKLSPGTLCVVCEDLATGNHYSVPSCNGCKTFFRRAVVNKRNFICIGQGQCSVNKGVRCACRSCRLVKCLAVGMDRNSIQNDRDRIGYTKRTRRNEKSKSLNLQASPFLSVTSSNSSGDGDNHSRLNEHLTDDEDSLCFPSTSDDVLDVDQIGLNDVNANKPNAVIGLANTLEKLTQLENNFSLLLSRDQSIVPYASLEEALDAPSRFSRPVDVKITDPIVEPDASKDQQKHPFWRSRIIALYIDWAKTFSVFRKLPQSDKIALITNHASSYMIMCEALRTPELIKDQKSEEESSENGTGAEEEWSHSMHNMTATDVLPRFKPSSASTALNVSPLQTITVQSQNRSVRQSDHAADISDELPTLANTTLNIEKNVHTLFDLNLLENSCSRPETGIRSIIDVPSAVHYPTVGSLSRLTPVMAAIIDCVMKPFRRLKISTAEFAALQAIMFFDPDTEGLDAASQRNVFAEQKRFISALYYEISQNYDESKVGDRFAEIILRIPIIRKVAAKKNESLQIIDMCNFFNLSNLVRETALGMHPLKPQRQ